MTAFGLTIQFPTTDKGNGPKFESLLPAIRRYVTYAFRRMRGHLREEWIAEAIAAAYVSFQRLIQRGLENLIYATALARFAVHHVRNRRRIGSGCDNRDVLSEHVQAQYGFQVRTLESVSPVCSWQHRLLADRRATPAELVACKLDFQAWLKRLSAVKRRIALRLAMGDTTTEAAERFQVTCGRISQLRRELKSDWELFQSAFMAN